MAVEGSTASLPFAPASTGSLPVAAVATEGVRFNEEQILGLKSSGIEPSSSSSPSAHRSSLKRSDSTVSKQTSRSVRVSELNSEVHLIVGPRPEKDYEIKCSFGYPIILRRTGTYATTGLGYLVNPTTHEQELQKRAEAPRAPVFADPSDSVGKGGDGSLFKDHYDLLEEVSTGGFSTVFKASARKGPSPQATLAVKRVARAALGNGKAYDVFRTETSVFADLDHPNILWRRQLFREANYLFLVLDLLSGPSLLEKLGKNGAALSPKEAGRLFREMLGGVAYLHQHGIVHRDVKPENFMLETAKPGALLKLVDFAVSRVFQPGEVISTVIGTLAYVAPEVLQEKYDEKCDVWGCGCTAFVCSAGLQPISAPDDQQLMAKIKQGIVAWQALQGFPEPLVLSIRAAMQVDPKERPSAAELQSSEWLKLLAKPPHCCALQ